MNAADWVILGVIVVSAAVAASKAFFTRHLELRD